MTRTQQLSQSWAQSVPDEGAMLIAHSPLTTLSLVALLKTYILYIGRLCKRLMESNLLQWPFFLLKSRLCFAFHYSIEVGMGSGVFHV